MTVQERAKAAVDEWFGEDEGPKKVYLPLITAVLLADRVDQRPKRDWSMVPWFVLAAMATYFLAKIAFVLHLWYHLYGNTPILSAWR